MVLSDGIGSDSSTLPPIKLAATKDAALRQIQELLLEGGQIDAHSIRTQGELTGAAARKTNWLVRVSQVLRTACTGPGTADFFNEIPLNLLNDSDSMESLSEFFHIEMNQCLERLRVIRKAIDDLPGTTVPLPGVRRPAAPTPKPVEIETPAAPTNTPSPTDGSGVEDIAVGDLPALPAAVPLQESARELAPKPLRGPAAIATPEPKPVATNTAPAAGAPSLTKILLICCSRNGTARQALCRFAAQLKFSFEIIEFNPEQPSNLIEQIYHHRDAKFAVIYWGEPTGRELPGSAHPERYVGFALGFAVGRLGRGRVCMLGSTTAAPLPGFTRILVAQLDAGGGWQIPLGRRMKNAGIDVDLNKLT